MGCSENCLEINSNPVQSELVNILNTALLFIKIVIGSNSHPCINIDIRDAIDNVIISEFIVCDT